MGPLKVVFLLVGIVHFSQALNVCPGCPIERDLNDPSLQGYLTKTLAQLNDAPVGTNNELVTLVKLTKATYQMVSGMKNTYEFEARGVKTQQLYSCEMKTFERPWTGEQKVEEFSCQPLSSMSQGPVNQYGAEEIIDPSQNSDVIPQLKSIINEELNKQENSGHLVGVVKVFKASRQMVSGIIYKARVEVAETDCAADSTKFFENCQFQSKGHKVCNVEIWDKPWLNQKTLMKLECSEIPQFCAGCPQEKSVFDEQANQCLHRALFNLNNQPETSTPLRVSRVTRIQSQVAAGLKYIYDFEAEDNNKTTFACRAEVVNQPWVSHEPSLEVFECSPLSQ